MASKVVFLGSKPIGQFCFEFLLRNQKDLNIEIVGLLTNDNSALGKADLKELAKSQNISVLDSLNKLQEIDIDFLISVQYHEILKEVHINSAKKLAINLHMAPLPEYRGCNQFSFALIDNKKEFGTTLHVMDPGIDSGDILAERRFDIPEDCFVSNLYDLTLKASKDLFSEEIGGILNSSFKRTPQQELIEERGTSIHYRKEINQVKQIDLNWDENKIWSHLRATSMPGFDPPFAIVNGKKINLIVVE